MSSHESSGAPAEGTATNPAPASPAAPASFGSTRGSGLARGKRPSHGPAPTPTASNSEYKPTAIEIVNAPREYQNPFAPATPEPAPRAEVTASEVPAATPRPEPIEPARAVSEQARPAAVENRAQGPADAPADEQMAAREEKAELNILPPERPREVETETWESAGFEAPERPERPRRSERTEPSEPVDPGSIPEKFLYVRPGVTFVPTDPTKWGPGRRDRAPEKPHDYASQESAAPSAPATEAPRKSGGFFGWIKSLFGGGPAAESATAGHAPGDHRGRRRQRSGPAGENRGEFRGEGSRSGGHPGGGRRRRGGRGRGGERGGGPGGHYRGDSGGPTAT